MSRLLGRFGRWTPFLASWSLSVSLAAASSAATPDPRPLAEIRWQKNSPAIPLDSCVAVPAPVGPEDVLAIPGRKAVLVSSARRNLWNFKKNYGGIFRLGLEPLEAANLPRRYSPELRRVFPEAEAPGPGRSHPPHHCLSPVGMALRPAGGSNQGPDLYFVDGAYGGRVCRRPLDGSSGVGEASCRTETDPSGSCKGPARGSAHAFTPSVNGIGVSESGDILVTNARREPSMAWNFGGNGKWKPLPKPAFRFANGVAFLPQVEIEGKAANGHFPADLRHALVADSLRRRIRLLELSEDGVSPLCEFKTLGMPDNLHWLEGPEGGRDSRSRLLVGTFGSRFGAALYFAHLWPRVAARVWEVDLSSLEGRLRRRFERNEPLPRDCGIGTARWRLLVSDPKSKHLAGASAAVRIGDLLVVGQLRRPKLLVCPWTEPDEEFPTKGNHES